MAFAKWSQFNPEAKKILSPDLGIRSWDKISPEQKQTIWQHFINKGWLVSDDYTYKAVHNFNENNKAMAACKHLLQHGKPHRYERGFGDDVFECCRDAAQLDFDYIFHKGTQDVLYELISYYVQSLEKSINDHHLPSFINLFNDISNQFGLNVLLNNNGFILRQDEKITEEIYKPVLNFLNDKKWEPVNRDLSDATMAYLKNTEEDYSNSITLTISALQAFLQIIVEGKTGNKNLGEAIVLAQSKNLVPNDSFTKTIFKNIESVLMQERQAKGNPHPKKEYANEKTARLILNLTMVFMQHCIQ